MYAWVTTYMYICTHTWWGKNRFTVVCMENKMIIRKKEKDLVKEHV